MLNKLYTQADFLNLTSDDISQLKIMLDLDVPEEVDDYEYLYDNIHIIEGNYDANKIISEKLLAGQVSVKWFKFEYDNDFSKDILKSRLESIELGYNVEVRERLRLNIKNDIVSIIKNDNVYTIKMFISDGYKRVSNGIESRKQLMVKSIIVNIDIKNCWIEIRANEEKCKKINKILMSRLGFNKIDGIRILNKYNNINEFKNSLINGFYLKYKAIPCEEIELTEEDGISIATIIKAIDEYFNDKDTAKLIDSLEKLEYDTEGLSLNSILLAGIDNVGMKIRNDSERDVSKQSLYTLLKDNLIEDSSYIRFSIVPNGTSYTMQVGIKSNSIVFRSSVTEEVISYIRDKVL
ncbi:MAG: hypothetical protein E7J22_00870 [Clostridium perfringens]|nr:hypothetical protein [Clostridium perfringens]MDU7962876.1 hypothetical protein [Clostridium perfringens]